MKNFRNSAYKVTKEGKVYAKNGDEKMIQEVNGYAQLMLYLNKKMRFFYVHRIVAELFVPNPEGYKFVKHKDGNRFNNDATNLEWAALLTDRTQRKRNYRRDIPDDVVEIIRERYRNGEKQQVLADEWNVSQSYICNLVNNQFRKIKNPTE